MLMGGGFLFIYTRLRQQNAGHIWGRYFPHFFEKEKRLYDLGEMVSSIGRVSTMKLNDVITFTHKRVSTLARLRELAKETTQRSISTPVVSSDARRLSLSGTFGNVSRT